MRVIPTGVSKWRTATVLETTVETPSVKSLLLDIPDFPKFRPGHHVDIRLTAPDGYQAQRSYSLSSAPEDDNFRVTVELLDDGEVSPFLHDVVQPGDAFEVRGPVGGPFTWMAEEGGPLLLTAGGSGIAPIMSMIRHRKATGCHCKTVLLYSSRTVEAIIFRRELEELGRQDASMSIVHTLTRSAPETWNGRTGRIDLRLVEEAAMELGNEGARGCIRAFVCGSTDFVEGTADLMLEAGLDASKVATERFG